MDHCADAKGVFPFRMNQEKFYDYEGPAPGRDWFIDKNTKKDNIKRIETFPKESKNTVWCFRNELYWYLMLDVR